MDLLIGIVVENEDAIIRGVVIQANGLTDFGQTGNFLACLIHADHRTRHRRGPHLHLEGAQGRWLVAGDAQIAPRPFIEGDHGFGPPSHSIFKRDQVGPWAFGTGGAADFCPEQADIPACPA